MKLLILIAFICAIGSGQPLTPPVEIPKSPPTNPANIPKGNTDYGYGNNGAYIKHTQTLVNNDKYKLDGTAYANKNFHDRTPLVTGATLDFGHKPTRSDINLNVENQRHLGTKVTTGGQYNFFQTQDGRGKIGAYGEYSRHYNSPRGTLSPQYGFGVRGSYAFP